MLSRHLRGISQFGPSAMKIQGAYTALVTPFTPDGNAVDYDKLRELVEWQIEEGIDGLLPMGSTGEALTMSHEERLKVIAEVVKHVNGRVPVIAGTGSNSTQEALRLTRAAKDAGVDAALVVCPYYNKPSQKDLYEHFKAVAEAGLPVVLYNNPGRTGVNLAPQTVADLYSLPGIVAVKEGSVDQVSEIAALCDITIIAGEDNMALPIMAVGGTGVFSILSNISPAKVLAITRPALKGDFVEAKKAHLENIFLVKSLFTEVNPKPIKKALEMMGKCSSSVRAPLLECTEETAATLTEKLKLHKLL